MKTLSLFCLMILPAYFSHAEDHMPSAPNNMPTPVNVEDMSPPNKHNPAYPNILKPGKNVEPKGTGERYSGSYNVESAKHTIQDDSYSTELKTDR